MNWLMIVLWKDLVVTVIKRIGIHTAGDFLIGYITDKCLYQVGLKVSDNVTPPLFLRPWSRNTRFGVKFPNPYCKDPGQDSVLTG
jgi:hypothetical protein